MVENGELKICPECKAPTFKFEGCNFMTCYSPSCQGKTHFCYLCEAKLTQLQHFSHFKGFSPYGKACYGEMKKPPKKNVSHDEEDVVEEEEE